MPVPVELISIVTGFWSVARQENLNQRTIASNIANVVLRRLFFFSCNPEERRSVITHLVSDVLFAVAPVS